MKKRVLIGLVLAMAVLALTVVAYGAPAVGDLVGTVNFSVLCESGLGVGIAYDGTNLWYSCYGSVTDLYRANPTTGAVDLWYDIVPDGGLGALSYDATRNLIWAGEGGGGPAGEPIYRIYLDAGKNVIGSDIAFDVADPNFCDINLDDGLAFDARSVADPNDDVIYYSNDCGPRPIRVYDLGGNLVESFAWGGAACYNSGLALGGQLLYQGSDGCSHVWVVDKTTKAAAFDFSTIVPTDLSFRDEDLECDTNTFAALGKHVMWSVEAYDNNWSIPGGNRRAHAFEIEFGSCGIGGLPSAVPTDIRPQSCPNPLNVNAKGVLPVAILGTEGFDVTAVDPASVLLEGVAPLRWNLEDVATPFEPYIGKEDAFDCTEDGPDGYLDLTLKYNIQELVGALGDVNDGDVLVLELTGNLKEEYGGTPIVGEDVVVILKKR